MMAAPSMPLVRPHESGRTTTEALPPPVVPKRYVLTLPARESGVYWGYRISEYQRVCDKLSYLTMAELEQVGQTIAKLLGRA